MGDLCDIEVDVMLCENSHVKIVSGRVIESSALSCFKKDTGVVAFAHPNCRILCEKPSFIIEIQSCYIVTRPLELSHEKVVVGLYHCVQSLAGLHFNLGILDGESILIVNSPDSICVQLAKRLGLTVFTTGTTPSKHSNLHCPHTDTLLQETGGLGVNHILDFSVVHNSESKKEILKCLGLRGKWCLIDPGLQLDPPESYQLFMRGASLSFLNSEMWVSTGLEHGKFLHLVMVSLEKLRSNLEIVLPEVHPIVKYRSIEGVGVFKCSNSGI